MTVADTTVITLRVRYFAGARAAAGTPEETIAVPAAWTVADLSLSLAARHGAELAAVLKVASFLVDEVRAPGATPLLGAAEVDVLPPFAGG